MRHAIEIANVGFTPVKGCRYKIDYVQMARDISEGYWEDQWSPIKAAILDDLFFILYFVLEIKDANHPYVVEGCRQIQDGPRTKTLDIWAREHFKSTTITIAETLQDVLRDPEERVGIYSYARPPALRFVRTLKHILETNGILHKCFGETIWPEPTKQAFRWSEDIGLYLQRRGNYMEPTISGWGLTEGMPTGFHFTKRVYDDIVTADIADSPDVMDKVKEKFDMSEYTGTKDGRDRVTGTFYHHDDPLCYIRDKKNAETDQSIYTTRIRPGVVNAEALYLSPEKIAVYQANPRTYRTQILLDPTPKSEQALNPGNLILIHPGRMPDKLWKFMTIDPAGTKKGEDSWAIAVCGIEPYRDDQGASRMFILDLFCEPCNIADALDRAVEMYLRNGKIMGVGVEKVGASSTEIHVANALRAKGVTLSEKAGSLILVRTGGVKKEFRIESNLAWPLRNGKIGLSTGVKTAERERLFAEMRLFPFWHDDVLDVLSMQYQITKDYTFPVYAFDVKQDAWDMEFEDEVEGGLRGAGWLCQ